MRLRLFLNGDNNTRGVTFTLLNQLLSNNNHSNFLWSDGTSTCFRRPSTDMNSSYGFSKFFSLNVFQKK